MISIRTEFLAGTGSNSCVEDVLEGLGFHGYPPVRCPETKQPTKPSPTGIRWPKAIASELRGPVPSYAALPKGHGALLWLGPYVCGSRTLFSSFHVKFDGVTLSEIVKIEPLKAAAVKENL